MALNRNLKAVIRQGIVDVMESNLGNDGIDKDGWTRDLSEWLESTHPDYNMQLMMTARDMMLRQFINEYIRGTRHVDPVSVLDLPGLRREIEANNRIVQIRTDGSSFRAKKLADVTLREVSDVMEYYRTSGDAMMARYRFYAAIHREMVRAGLGEGDRVAQLLLAA